ncbi:MAG TPA: PQQ-binding-like beta-propeller repeat protein [Chloroflexota bacterium]|nr:PQQ-binding-like beta-propeller repeat protein [Chloroflexota bacterium]
MRHLLIVAAFVIVYLVLPTLHVDLTLPVLGIAFGAFLILSLLYDARKARRAKAIRQQAAADPSLQRLGVYVAASDGSATALDAADGSVRWSARPSSPTLQLSVSTTAAAAGDVVFVGSQDGRLYALGAKDGGVLWSYRTAGIILSTPAVVDGVVYVGSGDHHVYALGAADGAVRWRFQTASEVRGGPTVVEGVVYVGSDDHHVYALNARDGAQLWAYRTGKPVSAAPAVARGIVYVGSHDHTLYALRAADGSMHWNDKSGGPITASPAVAGGLVFVASEDQFVYAVDAASGKRRWSHQTGGGRSAPVVVDDVLYIGSGGLGHYQERANQPALFEQANVWALRAHDGKFLWRHYFGTESAISTPAVAHGVVYVSGAGDRSSSYTSVTALRTADGAVIWASAPGIGGAYGIAAIVAP